MTINVQIQGNVARIDMYGRFDFQVHREFKDAYTPLLDNSAVREIEIEMSRVDYLDSSALGMLMLLNERAKAAGKPVTLLNTSGVVSQVLGVANFSKIFNIKQTGS
ncbi:MAG: STAS domain-containing protein [Gallionella sp.]|nr:STAS domain-containing protein [Gallionella sp.]